MRGLAPCCPRPSAHSRWHSERRAAELFMIVGCAHESSRASVVRGIGVCAVLEKKFDRVRPCIDRGMHQRRVATCVTNVDGRIASQERLESLRVSLPQRVEKGSGSLMLVLRLACFGCDSAREK